MKYDLPMKLRLHDDSVRFRLGRSEVQRLVADGRVEAAVHFAGDNRLAYVLETSASAGAAAAAYADGVLVATLPAAEAREWAASDREAIESPAGSRPRLLVEKDFQCLHKDDRSEDAYPNPAVVAKR